MREKIYEIKSEVYQLFNRGKNIKQVAQILDESRETIRNLHLSYLLELEDEIENSKAELTNKQLGKLEATIYEYFENTGYNISKDARLHMPSKIMEKIKYAH